METKDGHPINDARFSQEQFMEMFLKEWDRLALIAYSGFQKLGPGLLFFDMSMVLADKNEMQLQALYTGRAGLFQLPVNVPQNAEQMIESYDPETTILVLLKFFDGGTLGMYFGTKDGRATPKQLYENFQNLPVQ
jgi:hypothetical protein